MPLPFIIAAGVAALGAGSHMLAKEINEDAERILREAQKIYYDAKLSLECAKTNTQEALRAFGYSKTNVLETSLKLFQQAFEKIKDVEIDVREENVKFMINKEEVLQLKKMSDIYSEAISSGATGVTAGFLIELAANGSLPIVTGGVSLAGTCLATGDIAGAAAVAGSSLSVGLSFTSLPAIAAPVVLFTGISAGIKADENLEKAKASLAEAQNAAEEMKLLETKCNAIAERSDMFRNLLVELDKDFSVLVNELNDMTQEKSREIKGRKIKTKDLNWKELELVKNTFSMAGAVKAVIDVPLLSKEGKPTPESQTVYNKVQSEYNKKLNGSVTQKKPKKDKIFCTGCGKEIMSHAKFCNYCGKKRI